MTTLYLVRHGETVDNANQIMQGQTQGELNENGIQQAQEVCETWKDRQIDVVIASDLKRSIDTARIIAEPHGLEVITTPLLREPGKKVLAVGHGIINKAIQAIYYHKTMSEVQRMMNAEVRVLEL